MQTLPSQLVVTLIDENDNTPTFLPFPTSIEVREDISQGTTVFIVGATDADDGANGNINYELFDENLEGMPPSFSLCLSSAFGSMLSTAKVELAVNALELGTLMHC